MTDILPAQPQPRRRLLRFLIPVLLAHGLLLASLPYWPNRSPPGRPGVSVVLAPIAADSDRPAALEPAAESPAEPVTAAKPSTPLAAPVTPGPVAVRKPSRPAAPVAAAPRAAETAPATPRANRSPPVVTTGSAPPQAQDSETAASDADWRDNYQIALRAALARQHRYPPRARRFGLSGEVLVAFTIEHDGQFSAIHLARSSNADLLDRAALDTVRRLGRFRPLPADYSEDGWAVSVPLVYRLD